MGVVVVQVDVLERPRVRTGLLTGGPGHQRRRAGKPVAADLVAVDDQRPVVANLKALDVLRAVLPRQPGFVGQQLVGHLKTHAVNVVRPWHGVPFAADPAMVAPLGHHGDVAVVGQCITDHVMDQPGNGDELTEQGLINLKDLAGEVEQALNHVTTENDGAVVHRVVAALALGDLGGLGAEPHDPLNHDGAVVTGRVFGALPVTEVPQRHFRPAFGLRQFGCFDRWNRAVSAHGRLGAVKHGSHEVVGFGLGPPQPSLEVGVDAPQLVVVFGGVKVGQISHDTGIRVCDGDRRCSG